MKRYGWAAITAAVCASASVYAQQMPKESDMQDMMKAMTSLMGGGTNAAPTADFREMKALLPLELEGMKRTKASGEKSGAMGMKISYAEGSYEGTDGGAVEIKISDMGGMGGFMAMAQAGWASSEIDRETDTGFERTVMYGNHKALEKFDTSSRSGEIQILVNNRFMVEVSGNDVDFDALKAAAQKVDLNKLAGLKPAAK
ncbi:MAG TPA: hypothetical protein DCZ95_13395 [Verrucomicrobia bacterium]|nr:hypothetical protein [Verrucomicrobiota bacterium]